MFSIGNQPREAWPPKALQVYEPFSATKDKGNNEKQSSTVRTCSTTWISLEKLQLHVPNIVHVALAICFVGSFNMVILPIYGTKDHS